MKHSKGLLVMPAEHFIYGCWKRILVSMMMRIPLVRPLSDKILMLLEKSMKPKQPHLI